MLNSVLASRIVNFAIDNQVSLKLTRPSNDGRYQGYNGIPTTFRDGIINFVDGVVINVSDYEGIGFSIWTSIHND